MGKQIEQMDQQTQSPQQPQLLFYNDNTNQTGPPYYVDLFIEAGLTAIIPFSDGNHHQIKGPDTCLLVSNKPDPPRPIMLYFDNLKQVVDRNGTLRQLIILNTSNQQQTTPAAASTSSPTYPTKRKSSKQIDSNNNNTTSPKNGLATTTLYGKCSPPNSTPIDPSQELASSPEHQYSSYFNCSLCYPDSLMNGNQLNGQLNGGCQVNSAMNPINQHLNGVPTVTNATNSIYAAQLPLIDPTTIPQATTPQSTNHSLSQTTCSTSQFNHTTANQLAAAVNRSFNLDNLLNNQNNNLLLKAAKRELNIPVNYGQFNGQTNHQFLLNSNANLMNIAKSTGKLSPKQYHNTSPSNSYKAISPVNGHSTNGHQLIKNLQIKEQAVSSTSKHHQHKYISSIESEHTIKKSNLSYSNLAHTSSQSATKPTNKAKSIYSHHYQDAYHPHLHANQQSSSTLNYELSERVRKDKYSKSLTNNLNGMKRREAYKGFKLIDKQMIKSSTPVTNGEMTNSYKRFDEIKSSKSVDSPVTSSSPISEHYDFSSEESESAQYSSTKQTKRSIGDDISLKNTKNLNSINYPQPTNHLTCRQSNKDSFKDTFKDNYYNKRTSTIQKNGKESLQDVVKRTGQSTGQYGNKSTNTTMTRKKLIQEDDRDDGFGDELDYRVYNVQHQQSNKLTMAATNGLVQKQLIANLTKSKQFEQKTPTNLTKTTKANHTIVTPANREKINQLDNPPKMLHKDELTTNESDLKSEFDLKSNNSTILEPKNKEKVNDEQIDVHQNSHNKIEQKVIKQLQPEVEEIKSKEANENLKIVDVMQETIEENSSQQNEFIQSDEPSIGQQVIEQEVERLVAEKVIRPVNLKQNEMPIVHAFNLIETQITSSLVRLKWTKNSGISLTNLDRPNYQIEMIYLKREDGQSIKCSRIVQQCSQKSCKIHNLNSEQEYTFRVRLVYEEQLYLSNDLVVTTLASEKTTTYKRNKSKNQQAVLNREQAEVRVEPIEKPLMPNPLITYELSIVLSNLKSKFSFIGKEKFYALFYLFLFLTLCYLFAIIFYNSYIH